MKKLFALTISILLFVLGINIASANTYKFDFTGDVADPVYQYDQDTRTCLFSYFNYMKDTYPGEYNVVEGTSSVVFSINQKELFTWDLSNHTLIKSAGITGADNFTADLTVLDNASNYECDLYSANGFDKLEVYFESDEEIPVIDYYTLDLTNKTSFADLNDLDIALLFIIYGSLNDDITPDVDILALTPDDFPFILKKGNIGFLEYGVDDVGGEEYLKLINQDKFTVDDNFGYSRDFLNNPDNFIDGTVSMMAAQILEHYFDRYNIVISNNEPEEDEESDTVIPDKQEEKKEETKKDDNPKTGDNILTYISILGTSLTGLVLIKRKQNN